MTSFPKMIYRAAGDELERLVVSSAAEMATKVAEGWGSHEDALDAIAAHEDKAAAVKVESTSALDPEAHAAALAEKEAVIEKLEALVAEQKGLIKALKEQVKAETAPEAKAEAVAEKPAPTRKPRSA